MQTFLHKLKVVFTEPAIRNRVLFVLGALAIFRMLAAIPIPGVDVAVLEQFFSNNLFWRWSSKLVDCDAGCWAIYYCVHHHAASDSDVIKAQKLVYRRRRSWPRKVYAV